MPVRMQPLEATRMFMGVGTGCVVTLVVVYSDTRHGVRPCEHDSVVRTKKR